MTYLNLRKSKRDISAGEFLFETDLPDVQRIKPKKYNFKRPWGVTVRYHDLKSIIEISNPDIVEFHLSYKDMDENISKFFNQTFTQGFVVHAPELFEGEVQRIASNYVMYSGWFWSSSS